jgi:uncharacterized membrane protein YkoI
MTPSKHGDPLHRRTTRPAIPTTHGRVFRVLVAGVALLATVSGARSLGAVEPATSVARAKQQQQQQQQVPSSLAQAIRTAERQTGERAREIELERDRGIEVYEIKTVSRDKSSLVLIDPASGNVVDVGTSGFLSSIGNIFEREDEQEDQADFARLEAVSMTLADAVETAEKETGGRAVEASVGSQYSATLFHVRVVKDFIAQRVMVDPSTGKVITVPRRDRDQH